MKILFYSLILFLFQEDNSHLIQWDSNSQLKWADFQGNVPKDLGFRKAVTYSTISIKAKYYEGTLPKYDIKSFFNKKESWTKTSSQKHLDHEKLHFDITEVHSRMVRKSIDSLQQLKEMDADCYKKAYRKIIARLETSQKKFNNEVYSSEQKQQLWIDSIKRELLNLDEYEYRNSN